MALAKCADPEARFITRGIENGHQIVTYREPVFHCILADEISAESPGLEASFREFLTPRERAGMAPDFNPPLPAKLGLAARVRLNLDARDPTVARIIVAQPLREESEDIDLAGPPEKADPLQDHVVVPPFLPGT